jgi:hypothetical protein
MFHVEFFGVVKSCSVVVGYQRFGGPLHRGTTQRTSSYWSVSAPESGLGTSSLVFQHFYFFVDGSPKPVEYFCNLCV